jgi:hypothetical protein
MKATDILLVVVAGALGVAATWWLSRRAGAGAAAAPPAGLQYHARLNPNGYTFVPSGPNGGGAWTRVTPEGRVEYWADVL